jgi:hypothetical protein
VKQWNHLKMRNQVSQRNGSDAKDDRDVMMAPQQELSKAMSEMSLSRTDQEKYGLTKAMSEMSLSQKDQEKYQPSEEGEIAVDKSDRADDWEEDGGKQSDSRRPSEGADESTPTTNYQPETRQDDSKNTWTPTIASNDGWHNDGYGDGGWSNEQTDSPVKKSKHKDWDKLPEQNVSLDYDGRNK